MSKGLWKRCPYTGVPVRVLSRISEDHLTSEGYFNTAAYPDCNIFCLRSFAALAGYKDHDYFRDAVLSHSKSPFHTHAFTLVDDETGEAFGRLHFTHQNSAAAGGLMVYQRQRQEAQNRGYASQENEAIPPA